MFLGIKVLLQPTIHFYLTVGSVYVCVEMAHWILFMTERKVNERLLSLVSPQSHSSNPSAENRCPLFAVWLWVKSHLPTYSISDSKGIVSRGNGVPLPLIYMLQEIKSMMMSIYVIDCRKTYAMLSEKKGYVCWTGELLASSQYVCGAGSLYDFVNVHLWAPEILETPEIFSSSSGVALRVFWKLNP